MINVHENALMHMLECFVEGPVAQALWERSFVSWVSSSLKRHDHAIVLLSQHKIFFFQVGRLWIGLHDIIITCIFRRMAVYQGSNFPKRH